MRLTPSTGHAETARRSWTGLIGLLTLVFAVNDGLAGSRIKDIAVVGGARDNQLMGYGLVVGIAGDGDKNPVYTIQTMANMLQRYGLSVPASTLSSKNVAAVMVTADIPAFKKRGSRLDVTVATIGDAKTLQGGVLVQTPLVGVDGEVYALAQGPLAIGGFSAGTEGAGGASVQKNHPTTGQIVGGAIVERDIPTEIVRENSIELLLREGDFTSSARLAAAVNQKFPDSAHSIDSTTVTVKIPAGAEPYPIDFIAHLEAIEVEPDVPARIIINERTGTIVATSHVRISSCAVSHGNVTISIASTLNTSQPAPFARRGRTTVTPSTDTAVAEEKGAMIPLPDMPSVDKVAAALNSLGVTPRDMMAIFQAMKQAGALQAELILR